MLKNPGEKVMRGKSFEEQQLSERMLELCFIAVEINKELDLIYKELESKGKWDDFITDLDKVEAKKDLINVIPENYYETLNYVFNIIDHYGEFTSGVELTMTEADLLRGKNMEKIEMPHLNDLGTLGIMIEPGPSEAPVVRNRTYYDRICVHYLKSSRLLDSMDKALDALREGKTYIFAQYR